MSKQPCTGRDGGTPFPKLEKPIPRSAMAEQHAREREAYRERAEQSYADFIRRVGA